MEDKNGKVLIVDDSPIMLSTVSKLLKEEGYAVLSANSGKEALEIIKDNVPDLFLLDIMMPDMDGYELCGKLKENPEYKDIPVMFITALDSTDDIVKGFNVGAVDYISKPFHKEEVIARVGTHIKLHKALSENQLYAHEMESLAEERASALVHSERLATLGALSAGIAHEINNPTGVISGNLQMIERILPELMDFINHHFDEESKSSKKMVFVVKELPSIIKDSRSAVDRVLRIIKHMKEFSFKGSGDGGGQYAEADLFERVESALEICRNALKYHVTVNIEKPKDFPMLEMDGQKIEQVLVNLFVNAAHATKEQGAGTLTIRGKIEGENALLYVEDDGSGIPENILEKIWDPFFTSKPKGVGTGLGLSIGKGIIEEHHGSLSVENIKGGGARFIISLPILTK